MKTNRSRPPTTPALRYIEEFRQLKGAAKTEAARQVATFCLHHLLVEAEHPGEEGQQAAEAALAVLVAGIVMLRSAERNTPIDFKRIAAKMDHWPMLVPPTKKGAMELAEYCRTLGVGVRAPIKVGAKTDFTKGEGKWAWNFVGLANVCMACGAKAVSMGNRRNLELFTPLETLPRFDDTEKCFQIWADAFWGDCKRRFPGELLRTHPDFRHLPGAKHHPLGVLAVPESRVRARLMRALRQVLNVTK
jgi:hypothetical protein